MTQQLAFEDLTFLLALLVMRSALSKTAAGLPALQLRSNGRFETSRMR